MANIEALNELKRVLREVPDERFNITSWTKRASCGTVCCALGWAAQDSYFNERGLTMLTACGTLLYPVLRHREGYAAGAAVFAISEDESHHLFYGDHYRRYGWSHGSTSRHDVIARIDHLIDHYTLQRDAHMSAYRSHLTVSAIIDQAMIRETVEENA